MLLEYWFPDKETGFLACLQRSFILLTNKKDP